jgi:AcrR family transcriptional regulator
MEQKPSIPAPKRRGRPRAYDAEAAVQQATDSFWKTGYAGTSYEEIAAVTGMNRPSLYAAFGDKRALYLEVLARYWQVAFADMRAALADDLPLEEALMRVYDGALSIYFSGDGRPRGCFVVGTAVTEAVEDAEIRQSLAAGIETFDTVLAARFRTAQEKGELKADADPETLAALATATMHSIAIRARAGVPRAELREFARKAIKVICG